MSIERCTACGKTRFAHIPDPPDGYWPDCTTFTAEAAPVITLCGSTKFKDEFMAENQRLTMEGNVVISVGVFGHTDLPDYDWTTDASDLKRTLDGLHFQKIRMADRIHVIDPGGYVGESTTREIAYAQSLGKPVTYLSEVQR